MLLVVVDDVIVGVDADVDVEIDVDVVNLAWYVAGVQTKEAKWSEPVVDRNHNQVVVEEVLWSVPGRLSYSTNWLKEHNRGIF